MYEAPALYDIAFSYRDYPREVDCLLGWYARAARGEALGPNGLPRAFLELAAGGADHAIEAARRGIRACAIDLSGAMCAFAREKVARAGVSVEVIEADMIDFSIERRFDLAATMISSLTHVPSVPDMVRHLRTVAAHLRPGGVYVVEQPHPKDFLDGAKRDGSRWTVEKDGITVETQWGRAGDRYDPIAQTVNATVEVRATGPSGVVETHVETVRMREWTAGEMQAVIALSGVFEIVERHGALALDAPFDSSPESWRMITVLRRTGGA